MLLKTERQTFMQQVEFWALEHNQIDKKQIKKIKQPKSKNAKS